LYFTQNTCKSTYPAKPVFQCTAVKKLFINTRGHLVIIESCKIRRIDCVSVVNVVREFVMTSDQLLLTQRDRTKFDCPLRRSIITVIILRLRIARRAVIVYTRDVICVHVYSVTVVLLVYLWSVGMSW